VPGPDRPLRVGIDAGTSRVRAIVFAPDGRVAAEGAAVPNLSRPRPGWAEYGADDLWAATCTALKAATGRLPEPKQIRSVGITSVGEACVLLDRDGRPTAPVIAWYDQRARPQQEAIYARLGFDAITATTGLCPDPIFTLLKLLWFKHSLPDALARARLWLSVAHFLAWRLGAGPAIDLSLASRTLALDLQRGCWADDLIRDAGIDPGLFPELRPAGEKTGEVTGEAARATGLPKGVAIGLGAHDHIAGALAIDALRSGVLMDSIGTAEALTVALDRLVPGTRLAAQGFSQGLVEVDRGPQAYVFGGLPSSGGSIEWFRDACASGISHDALIDAARAVPAGAGGVTFVPDLLGRLTPVTDARARGAFLGLRVDHDRACLFRAVLEGLAMDARQTLDVLTEADPSCRPSEVRAIGGGTRNPVLLEIKATLYGRRMLATAMSETSALGASLLGGLAAGLHDSLHDATRELDLPLRAIEPNHDWGPTYERHLAEVYRPACQALRPLDHRLADLYG
jgi:xylulokinase